MTQQIINIGGLPNDGSGDPLRTAFEKINNNFSQLFYTTSVVSYTYSFGDMPNQVIWETPIIKFSQGTFTVKSIYEGSTESQLVTISAQINNENDAVKFTAYATTFFGDAITSYDMDVLDGNVRLLVNPIPDVNLTHFINGQVLYFPDIIDGLGLGVNGLFITGVGISTQNNNELTTEQQ